MQKLSDKVNEDLAKIHVNEGRNIPSTVIEKWAKQAQKRVDHAIFLWEGLPEDGDGIPKENRDKLANLDRWLGNGSSPDELLGTYLQNAFDEIDNNILGFTRAMQKSKKAR